MYIVSRLYNTLNRLVEELKMQVGNISITLGVTGVVVGISIMFNDPEGTMMGAIIAGVGLALCLFSYLMVQSEEKKEAKKRDKAYSDLGEIKDGMKSMSDNIGNLVDEIRKDRENKTD